MYEFGILLPVTPINHFAVKGIVWYLGIHCINFTGYYETDIEDENGQFVEKVMCILFDNATRFTGAVARGYEYCCDDANGKPMYTPV